MVYIIIMQRKAKLFLNGRSQAVRLPADLKLAAKKPVPPISVLLSGSAAWLSLLEKWSVPA